MKTHGFDITRAQRGWKCDCYFHVFTERQFTAEGHATRGFGRYWWSAMWRSYRLAKVVYVRHAATSEERKAKGWV